MPCCMAYSESETLDGPFVSSINYQPHSFYPFSGCVYTVCMCVLFLKGKDTMFTQTVAEMLCANCRNLNEIKKNKDVSMPSLMRNKKGKAKDPSKPAFTFHNGQTNAS